MHATIIIEDAHILVKAFGNKRKTLSDVIVAIGNYKPLQAAYLAVCIEAMLSNEDAKRFRLELTHQLAKK